MKKATILLFMAAAIFACSRKTVASADNKPKTETAGTELKTTTPTTASTTNSDTHAALMAQGQTVYTTRCAKCHEAKSVSAYNTQQWEGILKDMIPKAKLDQAQATQVTAYVLANAKK